MKKNSFYLLAIMMAVVLCVSFTSCSDDDDTGNDLVGWYLNNDELCTKEDCPLFEEASGDIYYFRGPDIIHIIDDTYLDYYGDSEVYKKGDKYTEGKEMIYQMDGGKRALYDTPTRITYYRRTDKEISFVVPGTDESRIFLIKTDKGLEVIDGYWQQPKTWLKYDPNKAY